MKTDRRELKRLKLMEHYGFGTESMKKIKVCKKCGMSALSDEKFCNLCGTRLPMETLYQQYKERNHFCMKCGTVVSSKKRFCPQCGKQLIKDQIVYKAIDL